MGPSPDARVAVAALLVATTTGCIAASARLHVGAVAAGDRIGVQVGAVFGVGLTRSEKTAILAVDGFATGNAPRAGFEGNLEYVRLPEVDGDVKVALRGGFGATVALAGAPGLIGGEAGAVFLVRDRFSYQEADEKRGGGGWSRSVLGVGVEARGGAAYANTKDADGNVIDTTFEPGGSLAVTLEWIQLGEAHLF